VLLDVLSASAPWHRCLVSTNKEDEEHQATAALQNQQHSQTTNHCE